MPDIYVKTNCVNIQLNDVDMQLHCLCQHATFTGIMLIFSMPR